jgi:hypothetical protein
VRLSDKNKQAHEKAVADELLENLKIRAVGGWQGNPDKNEPDRLYRIDKKTVGIEIVTAYYTEEEAKITAEVAAEKPLALDEIRVGEVIGGPDDAICDSIQENLNEKCAKKYSGTDETWLCINADATLTEMAAIEECVASLEVPENKFARIFVTVHKSEAEGGGLGLVEIPVKKS